MPILIPNRRAVKPARKPVVSIANAAKTGVLNPCPVRVSTTGAASAKIPLMEPTATATGDDYMGFNIRSEVPAGASPDDEAFACISGAPVEGFTGVSPGVLVYVDGTARPTPEADFSGLTHTPAAATNRPVGMGMTPTMIYFFTK